MFNIEELYPDIVCPISKEIMKDPVITNNGISYEKKDILKWLEKYKNCPITGEYLDTSLLISNIQLKNIIISLEEKYLFHTGTIRVDDSNNCCIIL
jgi:hypothetical protein